jgi:hypothetical protein
MIDEGWDYAPDQRESPECVLLRVTAKIGTPGR